MIYRFGDFELDTDLFELRRDGEPVHMEPQVFEVLRYLVANHDRLVTKDELIQHVWGDNYISEAALNSRLMSARRAIGDSGREQRLIRTVFGRGFRFVGELAEPAGKNQPEPSAPVAPIEARPSSGLRLPPAPMPLIGRENELAEIGRLLADPACRLITLTGPGGIGKTRLAVEVARELARLRAQAVYFVQLQPVGSPDFVVTAIADAIGLILRGQEELSEQLFAHLAGRRATLILDNFEHLVEAAGLVGDLLHSAPDVKLLVTSREALNLREEFVFPIAGLPFPAADEADTDSYEGVQLFMEHARRATRVPFTGDDRRAITRIVRLVEGMPLAIELAASWLRSMSVADVAAEIARSRDFLSTSLRDVPERHRSMRAIFDESWRLLSQTEQRAFARLSVFKGSFERLAATEVAEADMALLSSLVDKSLLKTADSGRYHVHEVLRQYAEECLERTPVRAGLARARHCHYYLSILSDCFERALQGDQLQAIGQVEGELENIRAAWTWAIERDLLPPLQTAAQGLSLFYQYRGRYSEGVIDMERAVEGLRGSSEHTRDASIAFATLLTHLAWTYMRVGRLDDTERVVAEAGAIYERLGEPPAWGCATDPAAFTGVIATIRGDYDRAAEFAERARDNAEGRDNPWNLAIAYYVLTRAALLRGDLAAAKGYADSALEAARRANDRWFQAYCLVELGNVMAALGRPSAARIHYRASYDLRSEFGHPEGMAVALSALGELALKQHDFDRAFSELNESLRLYESLHDKGGLATTLISLGRAATLKGDYESAKTCLARSLPIVSEMSFVPLLVCIVLAVGDILVRSGDREAGAHLLRVAVRHPSSDSATRSAAQALFKEQGITIPDEAPLSEQDIERASVTIEGALGLPLTDCLAPLVLQLAEG